MTGWKSKVGAVLAAIGGALLASAQVAPPNIEGLKEWMLFIGTLFTAAGASFLGVGIAHKVEKGPAQTRIVIDRPKDPESGNVRLGMLFTLLICVVVFFLISCASFYPTPRTPVCDKPEAENSVICMISHDRLGLEPEQLDGILLDSVAIGKVTLEVEKDKILQFISYLEALVDSSAGEISYADIVEYLNLKGEQSELIAAILSRHLREFNSPQIVSEFDQNLMLIHLRHQREQLQLFKE